MAAAIVAAALVVAIAAEPDRLGHPAPRRLQVEENWGDLTTEILQAGYQPNEKCNASLYMARPTMLHTPYSVSTSCRCTSCEGDGAEQTCCCLRPESLDWSCVKSLSSRADETPEATAQHTFSRLLTCPLCPVEGSTLIYTCCSDPTTGYERGAGLVPTVSNFTNELATTTDSWWVGSPRESFNPNGMCAATLYMPRSHTADMPYAVSTMCQCSGCAGGGPGSFCCCQRPDSLYFICEYLMSDLREPERGLPWMLTCPLCRAPTGSASSHRCCRESSPLLVLP